jgi:hypothetical protein
VARLVLLTMLIGLSACAADSGGNFSATGDYNVDNELNDDLSGNVDDTDDTDDTEPSEDAPTIESAEAILESSGTSAVLLSMVYSDPQDDLDDGIIICKFTVDGGGSRDCLGSDGNQIPIDGTYARIDENEDGDAVVESRLSLTVDGDEYTFSIALVDADGNRSATVEVVAE